jgi:dihydroxy-acid dehydratase
VLLAIGGSTNAVIHLTAIARRRGIKVDLRKFNELSDTTPVLVNLKPVGSHYMEDFFAAGGVDAVMREIKPLLNLDAMTVTGETLGQWLAKPPTDPVDRTVVKSREEPIEGEGGLVALFGSLALGGAILAARPPTNG